LFTVVIQLIGLLRLLQFIMVIIHPFHRISEDARHCSALSYRQVADRDYRVPEVIDRHSFKLSARKRTFGFSELIIVNKAS